MTYAIYNLTDNIQLSIRGTTASRPHSKFVFGIFIENDRFEDDYSYNDMDWSEAIKMANWILEQNKWISKVSE